MKQIEFKTSKGDFLVKEIAPATHPCDSMPWDGESTDRYECIGPIKELKEEDWKKVVDCNGMGCYSNYKGKSDEVYTCLTAVESGVRLLKSLDVWVKNVFTQIEVDATIYEMFEEKVWENPYLFKKLK